MKIPKQIRRYNPVLKKHTVHKVVQAKKRTPGSTHPLAQFAKKRTGFGKGTGNLGKYGSKPPVTKFKMTGKKTSKRIDFRYECTESRKQFVPRGKSFRTKKLELV
ncbi:MAG: 50S ribosomal protein L44e [Candidatus Woesearchaeota archaeon]